MNGDEPAQHEKRRALAIRLACLMAFALTVASIGANTIRGIGIFFEHPPCESRNLAAEIFGFSMPFVFAACLSLQVWTMRSPKLIWMVAAFALPATFWVAHKLANDRDTQLQAQCRGRPVDAAMKVCRANPQRYVKGMNDNGYPTLTLIAPGKTDAAWTCLHRWANASDSSTELLVDETVYEATQINSRNSPLK